MKRMIDNSETLEHLIFKAIDITFNDNSTIKLSESLEAKRLVKHIEYCYNNQVPLIIYEYANDQVFVATNFGDSHEVYLHNLHSNVNVTLSLVYDGQDTLSISLANETFLTAAEAPKMYRHQITIRFGTDNKEVYYVVYSSNNTVITDYDKFNAVAKPESNFNYTATYVNGNNAEPAFIRFASGTILVGLSTGIDSYNSVADIVTEA